MAQAETQACVIRHTLSICKQVNLVEILLNLNITTLYTQLVWRVSSSLGRCNYDVAWVIFVQLSQAKRQWHNWILEFTYNVDPRNSLLLIGLGLCITKFSCKRQGEITNPYMLGHAIGKVIPIQCKGLFTRYHQCLIAHVLFTCNHLVVHDTWLSNLSFWGQGTKCFPI